MTTQWVFNELKTVTERNLQLLRKRMSGLSEKQLNWKPSDAAWNILEITAHLNEYARFYHAAFRNRIETTRFRQPKENFVSSPLGRSAWMSMKLGNAKNVKRKFNAPKQYNPTYSAELVKQDGLENLIRAQQELLQVIDLATEVNIRKVKVPISISKIIRLRLGDALLFVVYHNERHIQQALNVIQSPKFPKK
jgi:hypothetical protein